MEDISVKICKQRWIEIEVFKIAVAIASASGLYVMFFEYIINFLLFGLLAFIDFSGFFGCSSIRLNLFFFFVDDGLSTFQGFFRLRSAVIQLFCQQTVELR